MALITTFPLVLPKSNAAPPAHSSFPLAWVPGSRSAFHVYLIVRSCLLLAFPEGAKATTRYSVCACVNDDTPTLSPRRGNYRLSSGALSHLLLYFDLEKYPHINRYQPPPPLPRPAPTTPSPVSPARSHAPRVLAGMGSSFSTSWERATRHFLCSLA